MVEPEIEPSTGAARPAPAPGELEDPFAKAGRRFLLACAAIALGLAIAGTADRATGGVVLLVGWLAAVASLHRLGRAGSTPRG